MGYTSQLLCFIFNSTVEGQVFSMILSGWFASCQIIGNNIQSNNDTTIVKSVKILPYFAKLLWNGTFKCWACIFSRTWHVSCTVLKYNSKYFLQNFFIRMGILQQLIRKKARSKTELWIRRLIFKEKLKN